MIVALGLGLVAVLLLVGFNSPVALGLAAIVCIMLTPIPLEILGQRMMSQDDLLAAIALFIFYGRLCGEMNIRVRLATTLIHFFGRSRLAATSAETIAALVQPDAAGDALLQRNDEAAAAVNRLRLAGMDGRSAIGYAAALSFLRVVAPPSILIVIAARTFGLSSIQMLAAMVLLALAGGALLVLLAVPTGSVANESSPPANIEAGALLWLAPPMLILGMIFTGISTPSEAAAVTAAVALGLGLVQQQISGQRLMRATLDALQDTGAILLVVIFAETLGFVFQLYAGDVLVTDWSAGLPPGMGAAILLVSLLVSSALIGPLPTIVVLGPLFFPTIAKLNLDQYSLASAFVVAIALGLLIPPTGPVFATLMAGTREPYSSVVRGVMYFGIVGAILIVVAALGLLQVRL